MVILWFGRVVIQFGGSLESGDLEGRVDDEQPKPAAKGPQDAY